MSKFMAIAGILAAAAGVALALMGYVSPGPLQVVGLTPEVAAILLIGGLGLIGIGGIIGVIEHSTRDTHQWAGDYEAPHHAETAVATTAAVGASEIAEEISDKARDVVQAARVSTSETIAALDKAKEDISKALGVTSDAPVEVPPPPAAPPLVTPPVTAAPAPAAKEDPPVVEGEATEVDEDQLFVVDEKVIRGRPARVLSDGTVEAETDEGWMRFENLEHLEEYLESVTPPAKA